ncbi:hypothetical protein RAH32_12795 [Paracoccus sp. WLY502]|uniref:hypothetical protein n=1 Tax=Paracoccus yibinensis TaxID=3068891 RepID=UPI002796A126|nr:hypothetical protein [Paracoccus sp. WLY502]MDQ1901320.1 hypothetical protein [Paracoccus sp. WLY502]
MAFAILSSFQDFLEDPAGVLSADARNPDPRDKEDNRDLDDPSLAYLSDGALPDPATGCIIGVIDDAIPFVHQRFTLPGNLSRMASVWLQDARFRPETGDDLPTGAEWRGAELSDLLARAASGDIAGEETIYRMTGAVDLTRSSTPSGAFEAGHGAAVAPLAAGFDPADPRARNHPLIAVCLPPRITADSMGVLAPVPILAGILFIINRARRLCRFIERRHDLTPGSVRLPVVINISLGLTAGPRDGSTPLERFMDAVSDFPAPDLGPIHFVLPVGNHRQDRLRARLKPGQDVAWRLPPDDSTINAIEIWGPPHAHFPRGDLQITLTVPGLAPATTAFTLPWQYSVLSGPDGRPLARAYYTPHQTRAGQWRDGITVIAVPTCPERLGEAFAPPGEWRVRIADASPGGIYDLAAQRDEVIRGFRRGARQSWFHDPGYRSHEPSGFPILTDAQNGGDPSVIRTDTVNAYATGERPLRGGAIHRHEGTTTPYSALLNDGQPGDCLVPVDRAINSPGMILRGRDSGSFEISSGTSMAAPQLARWLARQLSDGQRPGSRAAIRQLAENQSARPAPTPVLDFPTRFPEF